MKGGVYMLENYPDVLTSKELKEILFIGKNKLYELLSSNELKSVRVGRDWRILKSELIAFLEKGK